MKTLGLIGGTTWASTAEYYRHINEMTIERLGGLHSARILMYSIDLEDLVSLAEKKDWSGVDQFLTGIALKLEAAGADAIVICANTPHIAAESIKRAIKIPLIHIAEVTAREIVSRSIDRVALLGTRPTMEGDFYLRILASHQLETIVPELSDREWIHESIFNELGKSIFTQATKDRYIRIIDSLVQSGAKGVILGCTEIPLLIKQEDSPVPVFDTIKIHAKAAVDFALSD